MCHELSKQEEMNSEWTSKGSQKFSPRPNIDKVERKILRLLKSDKNRIVLTVGKEVVMVVKDRQDYQYEAKNLLEQSKDPSLLPRQINTRPG